jgi:uncharacterized protein (TIGR03435 family)
MFERYTERARRVLFFARYEATQLNSRAIDPWHLLLGLCRDGRGLGGELLFEAGLALDTIRRAVTLERSETPVPTSVEVPFDADAKVVLTQASEEADALGHTYIGTEHLLLAILAHGESPAAAFLIKAGMSHAGARATLAQRLGDSELVPPDGAQTTSLKIGPSRPGQRASDHSHPQGWSLQGLTLRAVLAKLCDIREDRIELPSSLDRDDRYDVSLWLPSGGTDTKDRLLREGVLQHFAIDVQLEDRTVDVYVLSAPDGPGKLPAPSPSSEDALGLEFSTVSVTVTSRDADPGSTAGSAVTGISGSEFTMDALAQVLEQHFQKPVVNETGLTGAYSLDLETEARTTSEFLATLKQTFGLALTPARRAITMLAVQTFPPPPRIR